MAKAIVETVVVTPAQAAVTEQRVVLNLTQEEAEIVRALVGNIAGDYTNARRTASSVYRALDDAGVGRGKYRFTETFYFKE